VTAGTENAAKARSRSSLNSTIRAAGTGWFAAEAEESIGVDFVLEPAHLAVVRPFEAIWLRCPHLPQVEHPRDARRHVRDFGRGQPLFAQQRREGRARRHAGGHDRLVGGQDDVAASGVKGGDRFHASTRGRQYGYDQNRNNNSQRHVAAEQRAREGGPVIPYTRTARTWRMAVS
jgi:hypothetical protein